MPTSPADTFAACFPIVSDSNHATISLEDHEPNDAGDLECRFYLVVRDDDGTLVDLKEQSLVLETDRLAEIAEGTVWRVRGLNAGQSVETFMPSDLVRKRYPFYAVAPLPTSLDKGLWLDELCQSLSLESLQWGYEKQAMVLEDWPSTAQTIAWLDVADAQIGGGLDPYVGNRIDRDSAELDTMERVLRESGCLRLHRALVQKLCEYGWDVDDEDSAHDAESPGHVDEFALIREEVKPAIGRLADAHHSELTRTLLPGFGPSLLESAVFQASEQQPSLAQTLSSLADASLAQPSAREQIATVFRLGAELSRFVPEDEQQAHEAWREMGERWIHDGTTPDPRRRRVSIARSDASAIVVLAVEAAAELNHQRRWEDGCRCIALRYGRLAVQRAIDALARHEPDAIEPFVRKLVELG